jgi:hypothetical protein
MKIVPSLTNDSCTTLAPTPTSIDPDYNPNSLKVQSEPSIRLLPIKNISQKGKIHRNSGLEDYIARLIVQTYPTSKEHMTEIAQLVHQANALMRSFEVEMTRYVETLGRNTGSQNKKRCKAYNAMKQIRSDFQLIRSSLRNAISSTLRTHASLVATMPDRILVLNIKKVRVFDKEQERFVYVKPKRVKSFQIRRKVTARRNGKPIEYTHEAAKNLTLNGTSIEIETDSSVYYDYKETIRQQILPDLKRLYTLYGIMESQTDVFNNWINSHNYNNYYNEVCDGELTVETIMKKWRKYSKRTFAFESRLPDEMLIRQSRSKSKIAFDLELPE